MEVRAARGSGLAHIHYIVILKTKKGGRSRARKRISWLLSDMELWQLQQLQGLPLEVKIKKSEFRITEWYEYYDGNVYVARSGGKDSDVLGDIVKRLYPDVPQVFINTGLEYDSVRKHGIEVADKVIYPEISFPEVIKKYGYPIISKEVAQTIHELQRSKGDMSNLYRMKKLNGELLDQNGNPSLYNIPQYKFLLNAPFLISHMCCNIMKKNPAKRYEKESGNYAYLGIMACEGNLRKNKWLQNGCNAFNLKRPTSQPLSFWTEQDILHYIKKYNVKIADEYGEIVNMDSEGMVYHDSIFTDYLKLTTTGDKRTGCAFCLFGITSDKERLLRLKNRDFQKYQYIMRGGKFNEAGKWEPHQGLGYRFVIDWLNENGGLNILY